MFKFLISTDGTQQIYEYLIEKVKRIRDEDERHLQINSEVPFVEFMEYLEEEYLEWDIEEVNDQERYQKADEEGTCFALSDIMSNVRLRDDSQVMCVKPDHRHSSWS